MYIYFSIEEAVEQRYSVRNYSEQDIGADKRKNLESFVAALNNPFGKKVNFHYLDSEDLQEEKLGTYGIIKGASHYIGTTIKLEPMALEALGYELEAVVLYLTHLGLGTCWLGGTFNRKTFAKAMSVGEDDVLPIIIPYGYPSAKKHMKEIFIRRMIHADHRKEWDQLFFINDFQLPFTKKEAGYLEFPLEMVRLGPSASNKQPWRVLKKDRACHFYEYKEPRYSDGFSYDIQRVDMGIAAAHFDFALKQKGYRGSFVTTCQPQIETPDNMEYVFSWLEDTTT